VLCKMMVTCHLHVTLTKPVGYEGRRVTISRVATDGGIISLH
jgi:hypothetical protein